MKTLSDTPAQQEAKQAKQKAVAKAKKIRKRATSSPHIYKEGKKRRATIKAARAGVKAAKKKVY